MTAIRKPTEEERRAYAEKHPLIGFTAEELGRPGFDPKKEAHKRFAVLAAVLAKKRKTAK